MSSLLRDSNEIQNKNLMK